MTSRRCLCGCARPSAARGRHLRRATKRCPARRYGSRGSRTVTTTWTASASSGTTGRATTRWASTSLSARNRTPRTCRRRSSPPTTTFSSSRMVASSTPSASSPVPARLLRHLRLRHLHVRLRHLRPRHLRPRHLHVRLRHLRPRHQLRARRHHHHRLRLPHVGHGCGRLLQNAGHHRRRTRWGDHPSSVAASPAATTTSTGAPTASTARRRTASSRSRATGRVACPCWATTGPTTTAMACRTSPASGPLQRRRQCWSAASSRRPSRTAAGRTRSSLVP